jgi:SH3-like domain-containing protein
MKFSNWFQILFLSLTFNAFAHDAEFPKFASIKSNEVNTRVGPGLQYPVSIIFTNKGEPVEIIAKFNDWRQIRDIEKETSWVHVSLLAKKRSVIITSALPTSLYKKSYPESKIIAHVFPKVRCEFLNYCNKNWCKICCSGYKGWAERKNIWGIYEREFQEDNTFMLYFKNIF